MDEREKAYRKLEEAIHVAKMLSEMCEQQTGMSFEGYKEPVFNDKSLEKTDYARKICGKRGKRKF